MATIAYALTAAAAVALAGVIAAELTFTRDPLEQAMAVVEPQPLLPARPPPPERRDQGAASALTVLARPLFNPDRRPPAPPAAPTPPPDSLPRLAGTLVGPGGKRAIFATGDKPAVVAEGNRIDAWTVQAISAGMVTLTGPDGPRVLHVSFATGDTTHKVRVVELPLSLRPVRTHSRIKVVAGR